MRPMKLPTIIRRKTRQVRVGSMAIGGDAPVSIQSMTNTRTSDVDATLAQIHRRLKAEFDPAGIFNRGRMYPDL